MARPYFVLLWSPRLWLSLGLLGLVGCTRPSPEQPRFGRYAISAPKGAQETAPGIRAEVLLSPERTGFEGASLALLEIELAHSVPMHRHDGAELLFFLAGDGELVTRELTTVNAREGVWLPAGTVHGFRANARSQILALYVPAGAERQYLSAGDPGTVVVESPEAGAPNSPAPVKFSPGTSAPIRVAGGTGVVRLGLESTQSPAPPASCALLELAPGGAVPEHTHADSAEILYVFEGAALMKIDGREERLEAPTAVLIAPGVKHEVTVTSAIPFRSVQWYTPPGPEQRFKPK